MPAIPVTIKIGEQIIRCDTPTAENYDTIGPFGDFLITILLDHEVITEELADEYMHGKAEFIWAVHQKDVCTEALRLGIITAEEYAAGMLSPKAETYGKAFLAQAETEVIEHLTSVWDQSSIPMVPEFAKTLALQVKGHLRKTHIRQFIVRALFNWHEGEPLYPEELRTSIFNEARLVLETQLLQYVLMNALASDTPPRNLQEFRDSDLYKAHGDILAQLGTPFDGDTVAPERSESLKEEWEKALWEDAEYYIERKSEEEKLEQQLLGQLTEAMPENIQQLLHALRESIAIGEQHVNYLIRTTTFLEKISRKRTLGRKRPYTPCETSHTVLKLQTKIKDIDGKEPDSRDQKMEEKLSSILENALGSGRSYESQVTERYLRDIIGKIITTTHSDAMLNSFLQLDNPGDAQRLNEFYAGIEGIREKRRVLNQQP